MFGLMVHKLLMGPKVQGILAKPDPWSATVSNGGAARLVPSMGQQEQAIKLRRPGGADRSATAEYSAFRIPILLYNHLEMASRKVSRMNSSRGGLAIMV